MLFPSYIFLLFFLPLLLLLYYTVFKGNLNRQNILLLIASLFFYSWGEPAFVFAMLACIFVNWGFGYICLKIPPPPISSTDPVGADSNTPSYKLRKAAFIITIIADLSLLAWFKCAGFVITNVNSILPFNIPVPDIALPIGISFFTFQALSYTIDVYRGTVKPQEKLRYVALYISLFPQLIAGPIVRYSTIEKELTDRHFDWDSFSSGVSRFIIGLGKKTIIANVIALGADFAFNKDPATLSVAAAWLGTGAYALQIYFDFSGYSDMAIGLGRMFGFHFLENFNYPYISRSVSDFWRRWHISLSSWFRDYVYFPLGGSRVKSKLRLAFNLFVVWALTGIWHGANWTFVFWGLFYFAFIAFEKLTGLGQKIEKIPVISNVYTLVCVLIGWVLFRSPDIGFAIKYLSSMFGLNSNPIAGMDSYWIAVEYSFTWVIGIVASLPVVKWVTVSKKRNNGELILTDTVTMTILKWVYLAAVALLALGHIAGSNYNPFIYFNF